MEAILTTDADRLEGAGIPLRIGERDVRVRFSMRSMKALEARYGTLVAANGALQQLVAGDHPTPYTEMPAVLALGLLHEPVTEGDLLDLGPKQYPILRQALIDAVIADFPDPEPVGKADEEAQAAPLPGATSTSSPPSVSDAAMASSGT